MKILILTVGRTGSTNLLNSLSKEFKYFNIDEPFIGSNSNNKKIKNLQIIKNSKDIIVKHIISHNFLEISELLKYFDKTVIVTRKNINTHLESILNLKFKEYNLKNNYHSKYVYEDIPISFINAHKKEILNYINESNEILTSISNQYNIPIIFYEDIYSENIEKNFKIIKSYFKNIGEGFKKNLDTRKKYRQQKIIDTLI